jgi:hypothetical protein
MSGYDEGSDWPAGSGRSFTTGSRRVSNQVRVADAIAD